MSNASCFFLNSKSKVIQGSRSFNAVSTEMPCAKEHCVQIWSKFMKYWWSYEHISFGKEWRTNGQTVRKLYASLGEHKTSANTIKVLHSIDVSSLPQFLSSKLTLKCVLLNLKCPAKISAPHWPQDKCPANCPSHSPWLISPKTSVNKFCLLMFCENAKTISNLHNNFSPLLKYTKHANKYIQKVLK